MDILFILEFAVLIFLAKIFGELAQRRNLPPVFGEILAGLIIGPNILGRFGLGITPNVFLENISQFALLILLFRIGLDVNIKKMLTYGKEASFISFLGIIVSFALGYLWGWTNLALPLGDMKRNILLGLILTASSVGISARVLADMNKLELKEAVLILEAAVIDDVLGLLAFSLAISWITGGHPSFSALIPTIVKVGIFLFATLWIGRIVVPRIMVYTLEMVSRESALIFGLVIAIFVGYLAEQVGLAAIAGSLIAGILVAESSRVDHIRERIEPLYNVFVPVFFVMIGINVNLSNIHTILVGGIVITIIAVVGKVVGCGLGALLTGFSKLEALRIGIGMVPRAEVPLVIATLALNFTPPLITRDIYGMVIVMTLSTTIITSLLLKAVFMGDDK